jgi:D-arabinose 1-dehydrogenase-like Zn-dependent alcohol dehydrogenase
MLAAMSTMRAHDQVAAAYERMMSGYARFRVVLTPSG